MTRDRRRVRQVHRPQGHCGRVGGMLLIVQGFSKKRNLREADMWVESSFLTNLLRCFACEEIPWRMKTRAISFMNWIGDLFSRQKDKRESILRG